MNFWRLLLSFIPVYKWRILFYILLNILCSIVSIISFSAVVPLLYVLFGLSNPDIQYASWSDVSSFSSLLDIVKNNILYSLQEQITHNGSFTALLIICTFIISTSFVSNAVSYFAYYVRVPIRTGVSRDLRMRIYKRLTSLPASSFRGENKGDFVGRMTTDIEEVDFGIGTAMDMLIENPVQIIVYLVTLFGISPHLAADATILLLSACTIVVLIGHYMKRISLKGQSLKGKLISFYEETIEKNIIIQVFNLYDYFLRRFHGQNESLREAHNGMNRVHSLAAPLADFMAVAVMSAVLFLGGSQVVNGECDIDAAELVYFIIIFHSIIRPTRSVIKATYGIRKAMASLDRMEHILNIPAPMDATERTSIELMKGNYITFRNVSFGYSDNFEVLSNLNIQIRLGSTTAIVGHNGKGKTSIVKLLLKLETDYRGAISIGGEDIKNIPSQQLRELFSFVPQEPLLFNDSVYNNILLGNPKASSEEVYKVSKLVGIHNFVMSLKLGYNTVIGEQGMNLSGGQRQAIAIARALLKNAPILVLDEATSGIDIEMERMIFKNIQEHMRDNTIIVIAHSANILGGIDTQILLE